MSSEAPPLGGMVLEAGASAGTGPPAGPGVEGHRSRLTVPSEGIAAAPLPGGRGRPGPAGRGGRLLPSAKVPGPQASRAPAGPLKALGASLLAPPWTGRGKQPCHGAGHAGTCESRFRPEEKEPSPGAAGQVAAGLGLEKEVCVSADAFPESPQGLEERLPARPHVSPCAQWPGALRWEAGGLGPGQGGVIGALCPSPASEPTPSVLGGY